MSAYSYFSAVNLSIVRDLKTAWWALRWAIFLTFPTVFLGLLLLGFDHQASTIVWALSLTNLLFGLYVAQTMYSQQTKKRMSQLDGDVYEYWMDDSGFGTGRRQAYFYIYPWENLELTAIRGDWFEASCGGAAIMISRKHMVDADMEEEFLNRIYPNGTRRPDFLR